MIGRILVVDDELGSRWRIATALRMAGASLLRTPTALGAFGRRMRSRVGSPKAITAVAHKLAKLVYRMLKHGEEYVKQGAEEYEALYRERRIAALRRKDGAAIVRLHELLVRAARFEVSRRRASLSFVRGDELDARVLFMQGRTKMAGDMGKVLALMPVISSGEHRELLAAVSKQTAY